MFNIARKSNFDKDFDSYLENRLNKGSKSFFQKVESLIPKNKSDQKMPVLDSEDSIIYDEEPRKSFLSRIFARFYSKNRSVEDIEDDLPEDVKEEVSELEEDIETVDEAVEELEDRRDGLLRRFFKTLFGIQDKFEEDEDIDPDVVQEQIKNSSEELKEETRIVLKAIHKWLSRLPPQHIDAFRRSSDFTKYKDLLEKYDLIKRD